MINAVLLDTSILIEELRLPKKEQTAWKKLKRKKYKLYISAITLTELWAGQSIEKFTGEKAVNNLLKYIQVLDLTNNILKKAGECLRYQKALYLADALIAASALENRLPLATSNIKHFLSVENLEIYNEE